MQWWWGHVRGIFLHLWNHLHWIIIISSLVFWCLEKSKNLSLSFWPPFFFLFVSCLILFHVPVILVWDLSFFALNCFSFIFSLLRTTLSNKNFSYKRFQSNMFNSWKPVLSWNNLETNLLYLLTYILLQQLLFYC